MTIAHSHAFPTPGHDHHSCLAEAMERAETAFSERKIRLTDQRRRVFEEIAASHNAIGAYEILERLAAKGSRLAPISVYRALEALLEAGVVHRLECRNAYFACHATHRTGSAQIVLSCSKCSRVAEVAGDSVVSAIEAAAAKADFRAASSIIEVTGLCGHCA